LRVTKIKKMRPISRRMMRCSFRVCVLILCKQFINTCYPH
jgi:hypothetical protein